MLFYYFPIYLFPARCLHINNFLKIFSLIYTDISYFPLILLFVYIMIPLFSVITFCTVFLRVSYYRFLLLFFSVIHYNYLSSLQLLTYQYPASLSLPIELSIFIIYLFLPPFFYTPSHPLSSHYLHSLM